MKWFWWTIGLLVAVFIVIFVVHSSSSGTHSSPNSTAGVAAIGKPAPDFSVQTIDGKQFSLAAYKGKPVILFSMFDCSECAAYAPTLMQLERDYTAQGLTVVGLDIVNDEPVSALQSFKQAASIDFPLVSYNANVASAYKLTRPDMTFVIDKNGVVRNINPSPLSYQQLKGQVEKTL